MRVLGHPQEQRLSAEIAREIIAITDVDERRIARIEYREQIIGYRLQARRLQGFARLADASPNSAAGRC
ncbi:hypothetical protein [Sphingomonas sp.]|uniref:hypothetical protein n=1 Tax=Sphingomonas sp. TaxID=28214 RepID=UPI0035BC4242